MSEQPSMAHLYHQYVGKEAMLTVLATPARVTKVSGQRKDIAAQVGICVPVTISDVRHAFNRSEVLVQPVGGTGSAWVSIYKIKLVEREAEHAESQLP